MKVRFVSSSCLLIGAAMSMVFAQQQPQTTRPPSSTGSSTSPGGAATATAPTPGVGQAVDPNKYEIGPEDVIFVQVWREADFTRLLAVRPDGKISLPLINDVQAAGLTPLQLKAELTEKLANYVNRPDVTITVEQVRSKKYYIDGEIGHTGEYPLIGTVHVLEALSKAGSFGEFANPKKIKILRGAQTFKFNYKQVIKGEHMEQNIELQNGDHIIVP